MKDEAATIEFFTPKLGLDVGAYVAANQKQGIHHVGRYQWACDVLKLRQPRRILDIACGAGYGSFMIAKAVPDAEVIGADYDSRAVDYAMRNYSAPNLKYIQGDIVCWSTQKERSLGEFDAVTSFDTIEHLLHREIALLRISENLSDDGVLLLSTPSGRKQNTLNPGWEHHKIEYSYTDLYKLMCRFFRKVMPPQHPEFQGKEFWADLNRDQRRYFNMMNPLLYYEPIRSADIPREYAVIA